MAIRALGFEVKKADVLKILKDYDRDGSGKISFQDFTEVSKSNKIFTPALKQSWGVEYGNEADVSKLGSGVWE